MFRCCLTKNGQWAAASLSLGARREVSSLRWQFQTGTGMRSLRLCKRVTTPTKVVLDTGPLRHSEAVWNMSKPIPSRDVPRHLPHGWGNSMWRPSTFFPSGSRSPSTGSVCGSRSTWPGTSATVSSLLAKNILARSFSSSPLTSTTGFVASYGWCNWSTAQALQLFVLSSASIGFVVAGDAYLEWSRLQQNCASVFAWASLAGLVVKFVLPYDRLVAAQLAIVVAYGTVTEYIFSEWLDVYTYRLGTLPMFIPPYHGVLFLAELSLATAVMNMTTLVPWARPTFCALVLGTAGYFCLRDVEWMRSSTSNDSSSKDIVLARGHQSKQDNLGLFWYTNLLAFVCISGFSARSAICGSVAMPRVQGVTARQMAWIAALVVVTPMEHFGSSVGTWRWREAGTNQVPQLESFNFTSQNPPSGVAGGYAWFNAVAIVCAPVCVRYPVLGTVFWTSVVAAAYLNARKVERPVLHQNTAEGLAMYHKQTNRLCS